MNKQFHCDGLYLVDVRTKEDQIEQFPLPQDCQIAGYVWNTLPHGKLSLSRGRIVNGLSGFVGVIWIGNGGEWNSLYQTEIYPWGGYMPIRDIVIKLKEFLTVDEQGTCA